MWPFQRRGNSYIVHTVATQTMSKKLCSTAKWKAYLKRRQEDELRKLWRRRISRRILRWQRTRARLEPKRPHAVVRPPALFSLIENPAQVVAFLREIIFLSKKNHLRFDLSGITRMTSDAIAALTATISGLTGTHVQGNLPSNPDVKDMLVQSGFFDHVRKARPLPPCTKGRIARKESKKVEPTVARDLIHIGTTVIHGKPTPQRSTYRVLIESMANTFNHATRDSDGTQTWWATVYADPQSSRVCYTFFDTGVGIFHSANIGPWRRAYRFLGVQSNQRILADILQGKVQSRTGLAYRGKGLPAIYRLSLEKKISSLVIIANDVYANIDKNDFRLLGTEFSGTLLYWEA